MRTRFDFVHIDNRKDVRPAVVSYTDAASLETGIRSVLGRFKQIKRPADARFYIDGLLIERCFSLAFSDGTVVVVAHKDSLPPLLPSTSTRGERIGPPATVIFLHAQTYVDDAAKEQLHRTARLPGMISCVGMPDLHVGSGAHPVGAAFLADRIIPALVGSDIGCGMALFLLPLPVPTTDRQLKKIVTLVGDAGFPGHATPTQAALHPLAIPHKACLGTIGAGNHFAEIQLVHQLVEPDGPIRGDATYLLVHSGSRTFGESVATTYKKDGDLTAYTAAHDVCVSWASDNRVAIANRLATILELETPPLRILDITHNSVVPGEQHGSYLHRKGAAPTHPSPLIAIPGSRGTFTYIVRPTPDPAIQSRCCFSVAHGAGRALSRGKVTMLLKDRHHHHHQRQKKAEAVEALSRNGFGGYVVWDRDRIETLYEEAPEAYKDVEAVVKDLVDGGFVTVVAVMKPVITCKI
ncbi:hypothetical protein HKX48_003151 [Thoreauomyces humboldtii]|nr:hypothetical protein HKX48_003151 [Thoreauomyces humboldtii]